MTTIVVNIKGGQIINRSIVKTAFSILDDGKYKVSIEEIEGRTSPQRKYYFKVIVPAYLEGLRHMGWDEIKTVDDAHEYIKKEFLQKTITNERTGEKKVLPGSTANLSAKEFNEFMEAVIKKGAVDLGIQIPFPNELMIAHYDKDANATIIQS